MKNKLFVNSSKTNSMKPNKKLQNIEKYVKELRDNHESHERLLEFRRSENQRSENENKIHHTIGELTTKKHYFKYLLVHLDVEQDKTLIKTIQSSVKECDYKIQQENSTLSILSDLMEEDNHLIKMYEVISDHLFMNIWEIEKAVEIHKLNYPAWKNTIDMDHYEKTGRIKNKKINL